jgi:hypothetical protein
MRHEILAKQQVNIHVPSTLIDDDDQVRDARHDVITHNVWSLALDRVKCEKRLWNDISILE